MSAEVILIPANRAQIAAVARRTRVLVQSRALVSAGAVLVPLPGFDIATDVGLLIRLITRINREFGLTPEQIDKLDARTRVLLYRSVVGAGATMIGKLVTSELVLRALQNVGARVGAKQAAKYLPVAGQALSAALSYSAMWYVGERHIRDCMDVAESVLELGPWLEAERLD
jgi:uncharacterized protein (DUF697 family)